MNIIFLYTILAAPEDADKWMNILFVVVLAVFWVFRGLFKEKIKESDTKPGSKKQPTRKPAQRSSERARALWEQFLEQTRQPSESPSKRTDRTPVPQQPQIPASKSVVFKGSSVSKQPVITKTPKQPFESKQSVVSSLDISPSKPNIPDLDLDLDAHVLPESSLMSVDSFSEDDYIFETLLDYSDSDELRKAILHYEILGKPLSIRSQNVYF